MADDFKQCQRADLRVSGCGVAQGLSSLRGNRRRALRVCAWSERCCCQAGGVSLHIVVGGEVVMVPDLSAHVSKAGPPEWHDPFPAL